MNREAMRAIIAEEIGAIAPEADLSAVGEAEDLREALDLDSMDIFNLVVAVSKRVQFDIPDADAGYLVTLGGGAEYLERKSQAAAEKPGGPDTAGE